MPKVYVVQKQFRQDDRGNLVPKFDLATAQQYGELIFLLSPTAGPFNSPSIIAELTEKLRGYQADDFLLLVGNPCLIGWATAIAATATVGRLQLLQWSGKEQRYLPIQSNLNIK